MACTLQIPTDWNVRDQTVQYGYIVADVLQSCSLERYRSRVSINPIVVQLYFENKNKWSVNDLLFSFVAKVPFLHVCIAFRIINLIKRNVFKESRFVSQSILIYFPHRMIAKAFVLKRDNNHVSFDYYAAETGNTIAIKFKRRTVNINI